MNSRVIAGLPLRTMMFGILLFAAAPMSSAVAGQDLDPKDVMGADECGECHKEEVQAWRATHHAKTFNELSRKKDAKKIARKMGIKRVKKESDCVQCHFTEQVVKGKVKVVAGITCESCHGAARGWMKEHSDYGGKDVKADQETKAHKRDRLAKTKRAGMIRPGDIYGVANNCYQCHLVPNEELVNKGGHQPGSKFELVAWSQGEVRHNYFHSADGKTNKPASKQRKRLLFVLGHALELEHALRAVGKATTKGTYSVKMAKRVKASTARLKKIASLIDVPEVKKMVAIAGKAKLKLNNGPQLNKAADQVGKLARELAEKYDGSTFGAIDKYLPKKSKGKAKS